jgi:mRNA interferase MazF
MNMSLPLRRGDVVLVDFPFTSGSGGKRRPALVIQNDTDNRRLLNAIVVMITTRTSHVGEPTQLLIDVSTPEGRLSGLHQVSVVKCSIVFTLEQRLIVQRIGSLSQSLMAQIDDCLKTALGLS